MSLSIDHIAAAGVKPLHPVLAQLRRAITEAVLIITLPSFRCGKAAFRMDQIENMKRERVIFDTGKIQSFERLNFVSQSVLKQ